MGTSFTTDQLPNSVPTKRTAAGAKTLDQRYYVCQEIFELEQQLVWAKHWNLVGHVSQFAGPRSFVTTQIGQYPLITIRGTDQQLRTFHNVCRHRGAVIETERCGVQQRDKLVCPYHGWSYDWQGRLLAAPNMGDMDGFECDHWSLRPAAQQVWNGWVFVCPDCTPPDDANLNALGTVLQNWRMNDLRLAHSLQYVVAANWKVIFENYSECYHCPLVHPALNRLTPFSNSSNCFETGSILGGPMELAAGVETMSMDGKAAGPVFTQLDPQQRCMVYYFTMFPTSFLSLHPDYVMLHRLVSRDPGTTEIVCEFYVQSATADEQLRLGPAVEFWDQTNLQDWEVCERVQRGVTSPAYQPGPLADLESIVAAFDRQYLSAIGHRS